MSLSYSKNHSKVPQDERLASPSGRSSGGTGRPVASGRFTSPSSLPVVEPAIGGGNGGDCAAVEDAECPERTTPLPASSSTSKIDSPERTGESAASGDDGWIGGGGVGGGGGETTTVAPSELFKTEEATRESAGGGDFSGGAVPWLEIKVRPNGLFFCFLWPVGGGF